MVFPHNSNRKLRQASTERLAVFSTMHFCQLRFCIQRVCNKGQMRRLVLAFATSNLFHMGRLCYVPVIKARFLWSPAGQVQLECSSWRTVVRGKIPVVSLCSLITLRSVDLLFLTTPGRSRETRTWIHYLPHNASLTPYE